MQTTPSNAATLVLRFPQTLFSLLFDMPTPVEVARQCLAQEAAAALDDAMAVACRRGHAQTTSLHMLSSLLATPNSCLRAACTKAKNSAYSVRVQFKALEISLSASLDRLPSSAKLEERPVANSLMAAIKRSQSNQKRQPDNFNLYHREQQISSVAGVKVELPTLVLSILDDPLVSRVFSEAGFRSCDVKMATLRPGVGFRIPHLVCYTSSSRSKHQNPRQFQYNLACTEKGFELGGKSYRLPFLGCFSWDENSRRIGEIMLRNKRRNPLLLGVYASDALITFLETLKSKTGSYLPVNLTGLRTVSLVANISRLENNNQRLDEAESSLRTSTTTSGLVINLGDFTSLSDDHISGDSLLGYLVGKLARMLKDHGGRLWLIGTVSTYEVYLQILSKFPSIEQEWDLEVLPIITSIGGSYHRSSLMESFVPLGGFFSMPSDLKGSVTSIGKSNHIASKGDPVPRILGFEVTENDDKRSRSKENDKAVVSSLTSNKLMRSSSPRLCLSKGSPSVHGPGLDACGWFMIKEAKELYKRVVERVGHEQEEAVGAVVDAITSCGRNRRDIWIHLKGGDRLGKRKLGLSLAEMLYGNRESFISVDVSFGDVIGCSDEKESSKYELEMRGTVVDYLVEKLNKKPLCVVLLENIDKSDWVVEKALVGAAKSGRLSDLHGREVSVSNCMFLVSSGTRQEEEDDYSEDEILKSGGGLIQICMRCDGEGHKRKAGSGRSEMSKRRAKRGGSSCWLLDLNDLPGDEDAWVEDVVDRVVVFKAVDFWRVGEEVLEWMRECLEGVVGRKCRLEMERGVMLQLLAAHYLLGKTRVQEWIREVVADGFGRAMESLTDHSVVHLVSLQDDHGHGHGDGGLLLPRKIAVCQKLDGASGPAVVCTHTPTHTIES